MQWNRPWRIWRISLRNQIRERDSCCIKCGFKPAAVTTLSPPIFWKNYKPFGFYFENVCQLLFLLFWKKFPDSVLLLLRKALKSPNLLKKLQTLLKKFVRSFGFSFEIVKGVVFSSNNIQCLLIINFMHFLTCGK